MLNVLKYNVRIEKSGLICQDTMILDSVALG